MARGAPKEKHGGAKANEGTAGGDAASISSSLSSSTCHGLSLLPCCERLLELVVAVVDDGKCCCPSHRTIDGMLLDVVSEAMMAVLLTLPLPPVARPIPKSPATRLVVSWINCAVLFCESKKAKVGLANCNDGGTAAAAWLLDRDDDDDAPCLFFLRVSVLVVVVLLRFHSMTCPRSWTEACSLANSVIMIIASFFVLETTSFSG